MIVRTLAISLTIILAVFVFSSNAYAEGKDYIYTNAYNNDDTLGDAEDEATLEGANGNTTTYILERKKKKKGKKGKKKNPTVVNIDTNAPNESNESGEAVKPFPCDPPLCVILDPVLPPEVCQNQCGPGFVCQGRHDMRIGHFNIAVCVPAPMGPTADGGGM